MIGSLLIIHLGAITGGGGKVAFPSTISGAVSRHGDVTSHSGSISASASSTFVNEKLVARLGDDCGSGDSEDGHGDSVISSGSSKLYAEGIKVARVGDGCSCGASVATGSSNTFDGG